MSPGSIDIPEMVDVAFGLRGEQLPINHRGALWEAVRSRLPWLAEIPQAGIHAVRGSPTTYGMILLPRRARLILRIPKTRVRDATALEHATLDVEEYPLKLGKSVCRELPMATTLYADCVIAGSEDESLFMATIAAELSRFDIPCRLICGRGRSVVESSGELSGFSLALHDVPIERSRMLQWMGLGKARNLGCGILVQYKTIADIH